jgi:hypothetical protein
MPVPKEELLKDLDTPEYQTIVKEALSKKNFVVQTKEENTSFLDRYKADVIEKEIPTRIKAVHDQYDNDIKSLYGVERDSNEKSYDYLKRAAAQSNAALKTSQDKIAELEEAIKNGKGTETIRQKLEQEELKYQKELKAHKARIAELEKSQQITTRQADVKLLYGEIKKTFIKQLPSMFAKAEAATLNEVINNSTVKDGVLYMTNADGSIMKDNDFNEITVENYLKKEFKDVIEKKREQGGAGSGNGTGADGGGGIDPDKYTVDNFPMKDSVKTRGELMDYMISLGIKRQSVAWNTIYKKFTAKMES